MVVKRQVGVTLPGFIKNKLYKIADIEKRSVSSICAEAVFQYMERWSAKMKSEGQEKKKK